MNFFVSSYLYNGYASPKDDKKTQKRLIFQCNSGYMENYAFLGISLDVKMGNLVQIDKRHWRIVRYFRCLKHMLSIGLGHKNLMRIRLSEELD